MKNFTIDSWASKIKDTIIHDIKDIAEYHARPEKTNESGFHSTPRHVFCYIDYLGKIAYGINKSTERAVKFIKDYFPTKYHDYAELIYGMWRHGIVHEYRPKILLAEFPSHKPKKIRVKWSANNDNKKGNKKWHLTFFTMEGKRGTLFLNINCCQLVDDLITAFDKFISELGTNKNLSKECKNRIRESLQKREIKQTILIKTKKQKDRTINDPIYNQILLAWKNRPKDYTLNRSGGVVKR